MATETYRYTSNKNDWDQTSRLILEGSSVDPKRYVDLGGEIELDEEEYERLSKRHNLAKKDDQTRTARGAELPEGGDGEGDSSGDTTETTEQTDPKDKTPARTRRG